MNKGGFRFLNVSGIMSTQIQDYDWSKTSLGPISDWSPIFRSQLFMILNHNLPMTLLWGPDLVILYNDSFIPYLSENEANNPSFGKKLMKHNCPNWNLYKNSINQVFSEAKPLFIGNQDYSDNPEDSMYQVHFGIHLSPILDEQEETNGVLVTLIDESQRIETLKKIHDQDLKIKIAMESSGIGFFETHYTPQNTVEYDFSDTFEKITSINGNSTVEEIDLLFHPEDRPIRKKAIEESFKTGNLFYIARIFREKNIRWILVKGKVFPQSKNNSYKIIGVVEDITQIKKKEEELIQSHIKLEEALFEQKALQKQKNEFLQVASHELRTPLTTIKGFGQLVEEIILQKGMVKESTMVRKLNERINHLQSLVDNLFDVSKIHSEKLDFAETTFDLVSLLEAKVEDLRFTTYQHKIIEEYSFNAPVKADWDRISQVVSNLLSNAVKYSPASREIYIRSYKLEDFIAVEIRDQGLGIPKEDFQNIFEQFYRSPPDNSPMIRGLGLGLYLSCQIIKNQGGKIWVESELGKGSRFTFTLPIINY